jgi:hypothetical protein
MEDLFARFWDDIVGRVGGPMTFRLLLQPLVAATLGLRAGLRDARAGKPPFLWTVATDGSLRRDLVKDGWRDVAKVFVFAVVLDCVYQLLVLRWLHPLQAVLVASTLALVPYLLTRGPVCRLVSRRTKEGAAAPKGR